MKKWNRASKFSNQKKQKENLVEEIGQMLEKNEDQRTFIQSLLKNELSIKEKKKLKKLANKYSNQELKDKIYNFIIMLVQPTTTQPSETINNDVVKCFQENQLTTSQCANCTEYFFVGQRIHDQTVVILQSNDEPKIKRKKICSCLNQPFCVLLVMNVNQDYFIEQTSYDMSDEVKVVKDIILKQIQPKISFDQISIDSVPLFNNSKKEVELSLILRVEVRVEKKCTYFLKKEKLTKIYHQIYLKEQKLNPIETYKFFNAKYKFKNKLCINGCSKHVKNLKNSPNLYYREEEDQRKLPPLEKQEEIGNKENQYLYRFSSTLQEKFIKFVQGLHEKDIKYSYLELSKFIEKKGTPINICYIRYFDSNHPKIEEIKEIPLSRQTRKIRISIKETNIQKLLKEAFPTKGQGEINLKEGKLTFKNCFQAIYFYTFLENKSQRVELLNEKD